MCKCKKNGKLTKSGICQNREFGKIGNYTKSGIWRNLELYKIDNLAKSGISQNREAPIRILMWYSTIAFAVLKRIASSMLYTAA